MFRPLASSTLALIAGAAPLLAEVTPAQVWENIDRYYADMGYTVSVGSRDEAGATLTLKDIAISSDAAGNSMKIAIPAMVLQETGDAGVRTTIEGPITADAAAPAEGEGDDLAFHSTIAMPDNTMLSTGSPEDMRHEITYPAVEIAMQIGTGADAGAPAPLAIKLGEVTGAYVSKPGPGATSTYDMAAKTLDLTLAKTEIPAEDDSSGTGTISATTQVDGLTVSGRMVAPASQVDMAKAPHQALAEGMSVEGKMTMGALTGSAEFTGTDAEGAAQSGSMGFSAEGSDLTVAMSRDGLSYGGETRGAKAELTMAELPFPLSYAVDRATGSLAFPVSKSDQPQPFHLTYALDRLTLADTIWDMFDPQKKLPRDPANLQIDVEGTALVTDDLLDPAFAERMAKAAEEQAAKAKAAEAAAETGAAGDTGAEDMASDMPIPFRPETVRINRVALDAVGAKAEFTGDMTIPEGVPQPVGTVEGSFAGVNALLDTLVAAGLLPQEQLMGARMMIAMFARPVEGQPDQLQTKLEFREDGSIFANGQQVK